MPVKKRPAAAPPALAQDTDDEDDGRAPRAIYLVTFSRVLPETLVLHGRASPLVDPSTWAREAVRDAMIDALDNPHPDPLGRGRARENEVQMLRMWVFREKHGDDVSYHFHVAVEKASLVQKETARLTILLTE